MMNADRNDRNTTGGGYSSSGAKRVFGKKRTCRFCSDKALKINYKDYYMLKYFITERGRIIPSRMTGNCAGHQRELAQAVARARFLALLPYSSSTL